MSDFEALEFPKALTHKYWNSKKGLVARIKDDVETGIGEATDKAEALYKKINWDTFDIVKNRPAGNGAGALKQLDEKVEQMKSEWTRNVKPLAEAVREIGSAAKNSVPALKKAKYDDAAKAAEQIVKEAAEYSVALQWGSIWFKKVETAVDDLKEGMRKQAELLVKTTGNPKVHAANLVKGLQELLKLPLPDENTKLSDWHEKYSTLWERDVKNPGRSVNNCMKVDERIRKHFPVWEQKFHGFDLNQSPMAKIDEPAEKLKETHAYLLSVAQEIKNLQKDLD